MSEDFEVSEEFRKAVTGFFAELRASNEALELDEAIGWTMISRDEESGSETHFGFFAEPAAALECAAKHEKDVNRGNPEGEPGWTCRVVPIFRADD